MTDVAVLGAGVVGLAVAARLASAGLAVVLLEQHAGFGRETSSRNSEVIHAGLYYPPGLLKAQLCVRGRRLLYDWCRAAGIPHHRIGKYIVAVSSDEEAQLGALLARGEENGVEGLRLASREELQREEPHVTATAALFSAESGIVDSHRLMQSLLDEAEHHGATVVFRHRFLGFEERGSASGYRLRLRQPDGQVDLLQAGRVVNATGLAADETASAAGIDVDAAGYRLVFVRGRYFRVSDRHRGLCRHLVYPLPFRGLAGLGIHVTLDLSGSLRLGPDVDFLSDRTQDYRVDEALAAPFLESVSRYLRGLTLDDLSPDQCGIRPRRLVGSTAAGTSVKPETPDFVVAEESARGLPGLVNLVGIESPGLTASLAIADEVARLLDVA